MKKYSLKFIIGFIYMIIFVILILLTYVNKIFFYISFLSLGLSLRAFYFTFVKFDKNLKDDLDVKDIRRCVADYFLVYPILISAILSFVFLKFPDRIDMWLKDVCFNPMLVLLSLYIGFDIYRLAGRLPK